jgi:hypothetical protein
MMRKLLWVFVVALFSTCAVAQQSPLSQMLPLPLPAAMGGTACAIASITCFNNITGFTASGTTGTTSTNLVFSTSPTLTTPNIGAATGTSLSVSGQLTSTVATGTAPLAVTSTTQVANLNAATLGGATFAAPGAIGGGTPAAGSFTGLTMTGNIAMGANGVTGVQTLVGNQAGSAELLGNATATGTTPTLINFKGDTTSGVGGGTGSVALIAANTQFLVGTSTLATGSLPWTFTNATITMSGITTGTNADFMCRTAGGVLLIQTSSCTISSKRFKNLTHKFTGDALAALMKLDVWDFSYKAKNPDPNGNRATVGILAEDVAKFAPACALYERDMKTPKSYKPECLIGMLVAANQQLERRVVALEKRR